MLPVGRVGVVVPEPLHQRGRQHVPVGVLDVRPPRQIAVGHRRQQHLARDLRAARIAGHLADDGGDVAAGTPAGNRQLSGHAAQLVGVGGDPLHCGETVVGRRREASLGRVAVVDRHDDRVRLDAQVAAERIVRVVAAEHPAAAVEVGDDGMRAVGGRTVQPVLEVAVGAGQRAVDDLADIGSRRPTLAGCRGELAGTLDRHRLDRGQAQAGDHLEHQGDVGLHPADDAVVDLRSSRCPRGRSRGSRGSTTSSQMVR